MVFFSCPPRPPVPQSSILRPQLQSMYDLAARRYSHRLVLCCVVVLTLTLTLTLTT